jgi:tRNA-specific 2-thiouridylase
VRAGEVVDGAGRVLAGHDGTFGFTVGQRRGLGVATGRKNYVVDVDADANRIVVGPHELLARRGLAADRTSWVGGAAPAGGPFEAEVQIRYRGEGVPAVVTPGTGDAIRVQFRTPQHSVAPGQSVVIYRGDELVGGARIVETMR